jgi:hypothetical protein
LTEVRHVVDDGSGVGLAVPPGWHHIEQPGAVLVLAPREWPPDFGFRPNLTVVVEPAEAGTTVHAAGSMALAVVLGTLASAHVASYDVWPTRASSVAAWPSPTSPMASRSASTSGCSPRGRVS